ncbi:hypothetical protein NDU88_002855 [Pleurodeles waltl]|uniref:Uncharacterized protein n=1 Tax=Pleurodeles waltl TaxID=8319 RepID=A0AAV7UXC8_PLEWA|nr:hypothetical protein NDU88_002855 [Pleurodeles waltl]
MNSEYLAEHYILLLGHTMAKDKPVENVQTKKIDNYTHQLPLEGPLREQSRQAQQAHPEELRCSTTADIMKETKGILLVNIESVTFEMGLLSADFCKIMERVTEVEGHVTVLQQEVETLKKMVSVLQTLVAGLGNMFEDIEWHSRRNKLLFVGSSRRWRANR